MRRCGDRIVTRLNGAPAVSFTLCGCSGYNVAGYEAATRVSSSESRSLAGSSATDDTAVVRFAVLHTISVHYLAPRIEELEQSIKDLRIRVISDSLSTCCQLLDEAACEFLLCYRHAEVNPVLDEANFARKDILIDQLIPVAEKKTAELNQWILPGIRIKPIPYLAYESSSFLGEVVEHIIGNKSAHLDIRYMDGLVEALKRRLITGGGIAWMPYSAIKTELENGTLVSVGSEKWETPLILSLYCAPDKIDTIAKEVWKQF